MGLPSSFALRSRGGPSPRRSDNAPSLWRAMGLPSCFALGSRMGAPHKRTRRVPRHMDTTESSARMRSVRLARPLVLSIIGLIFAAGCAAGGGAAQALLDNSGSGDEEEAHYQEGRRIAFTVK